MQSHERPLARPVRARPELKRVRVGPSAFASSVTVSSLDAYLWECESLRRTAGKNVRVVYRGQTREYAFAGRIISLLTGRERQSSDYAQRFNPIYGQPDCVPDFFATFFSRLRAVPRVESHPFPFDKLRPQTYFDLLNFNGLLQHYGVWTMCVDATTDPLVALWFALRERQRIPSTGPLVKAATYRESGQDYGVVYVMRVPRAKVGRGRRVMPNVVTADLAREIPDERWRPWRQAAVAVAQYEWGTGDDRWNRLAGSIVRRIVVPKHLWPELAAAMGERSRMSWLFPSCAADPIYRRFVEGTALRNGPDAHGVEWLVYPEYVWHFKWCCDHPSPLSCFLAQTATATR